MRKGIKEKNNGSRLTQGNREGLVNDYHDHFM
jgi:hypothetical protein